MGYVIVFLATLGVSAIGGLVSGGSSDAWYVGLTKSPLTPPDVAFAIVWPTLFVLMAISASLVLNKAGSVAAASRSLGLYFTQLVFNLGWSVVFFAFHQPVWSGLVLIVLWLLIASMIVAFRKWSGFAALLQLPYLLWVSFAGYLNAFVALNN